MVLYAHGVKADDCDDTIEIMIAREAIIQGVSVDLALAVAEVESGFIPTAVGKKGEIGLFQIMPYHASHANGKSLHDIKSNIKVGVWLLKVSLDKCADMGKYAVICYNNGVNRRPKYPYLNNYYLKIAKAMG